MLIADAGITLWIAGLLLIGLLGFFVVLVTMVFRFIGWVFRGVVGTSGRRRRVGAAQVDPLRQRLVCPHQGCAHANSPIALYCGHCGRPLRQTYDVDAYG